MLTEHAQSSCNPRSEVPFVENYLRRDSLLPHAMIGMLNDAAGCQIEGQKILQRTKLCTRPSKYF